MSTPLSNSQVNQLLMPEIQAAYIQMVRSEMDEKFQNGGAFHTIATAEDASLRREDRTREQPLAAGLGEGDCNQLENLSIFSRNDPSFQKPGLAQELQNVPNRKLLLEQKLARYAEQQRTLSHEYYTLEARSKELIRRIPDIGSGFYWSDSERATALRQLNSIQKALLEMQRKQSGIKKRKDETHQNEQKIAWELRTLLQEKTSEITEEQQKIRVEFWKNYQDTIYQRLTQAVAHESTVWTCDSFNHHLVKLEQWNSHFQCLSFTPFSIEIPPSASRELLECVYQDDQLSPDVFINRAFLQYVSEKIKRQISIRFSDLAETLIHTPDLERGRLTFVSSQPIQFVLGETKREITASVERPTQRFTPQEFDNEIAEHGGEYRFSPNKRYLFDFAQNPEIFIIFQMEITGQPDSEQISLLLSLIGVMKGVTYKLESGSQSPKTTFTFDEKNLTISFETDSPLVFKSV